MDSTIIAALIGAVATILSGIVGYFVGYNSTQIQVGDINERK